MSNPVSKTLLFSCLALFLLGATPKDQREYYQISIYHFKTPEQRAAIDSYLKNAWMPAIHKLGMKSIGVFSPIANDTSADKKIVIVLPAKSLKDLIDLPVKLSRDEAFQAAGQTFIGPNYNEPSFSRLENIILYAFPLAPVLQMPNLHSAKVDRVYELRSYESPTDKLFRNKVQMFNEGGEVALFKRLNFNAIFYAEVIAGSSMPNLMYMTSFESMADREAHWKTFSADPEWKKLSTDPGYQHNVSRADITLMRVADYSDY
jgi:NIPSNAP protein